MTLGPEMILTPQTTVVTVGLEPVPSMMSSLGMLQNIESNPGIAPWSAETYYAMSPEQQERQQLVFGQLSFEGILNAVPRGPAYEDFELFIEALREQDAVSLRDKIFYNMVHSMHFRFHSESPDVDYPEIPQLLADAALFEEYIRSRYRKPVGVLVDIDPNLHRLLNAPVELKDLVVTHVEFLWRTYGKQEWERVRPALEKSVAVLSQIDTTGLTTFQAIQAITGRDLRSILDEEKLHYVPEIRLVPSLHTGPYTLWFGNTSMLYVMFGARATEAIPSGVTALDNAELINRLKALADDTRLDILRAIKKHGELNTQEIIDLFELDKSAASRHLRFLRANEFLTERRDNKTKFYALNGEHIQSMLRALNILLMD